MTKEFSYNSSFFRIWKERFTGVSPIVVSVQEGKNGTLILKKLVFDTNKLLYTKSMITYTSDELPLLQSTLEELGH